MTPPLLAVLVSAETLTTALRDHQSWLWELELPRGSSLEQDVATAIGAVPAELTRRRLEVLVVLPPPIARAKIVTGLPPSADVSLLTAAVSQHLGRFFIRHGRRERSGVTVPVSGASAWVAAYDEDVLETIARAVSESGHALAGVLPLEWVSAAIACSALADNAQRDAATPRKALARAASTSDLLHAPLALGLGSASALGSLGLRRRWRTPVLALLLTLAASAFTPLALASVAARSARTTLRELAIERNTALLALRERDADAGTVTTVARFLSAIPSRTLLLAALASALPDSTAIIQLQADSAGVELTIVAPSIGATVNALTASGQLRSVVLVGGVSKGSTGGGLERGMVRAGFSAQVRAPGIDAKARATP